MSSLIDNRLVASLAERKGLAPFVMAGDGGLDTTLELLKACEDSGAVVVELGIPFSDPMADGTILQASAQRALDEGTNLDKILETLAKFRSVSSLPVAIFSYANPVYSRGLEQTLASIRQAGADAIMVPDIPVEESEPLCKQAKSSGLCSILFASPTTNDERLAKIAARSRGFIYAIGRFGVTGSSTEIGPSLDHFIERVKKVAQTPVGVGFGLKDPEQVQFVLERVSLAVVGSALVQKIHKAKRPADACYKFLRSLHNDE